MLGLAVGGAVGWAALGQIDGAALVPVIVAVYWVALTRARRTAVAAGLAGAAAIFVTEGLPGPFGWFGGPNATMWPELLSAGAVGVYVAGRRQWLAAEHDRARGQSREEETRRRVDAERVRIARELHDVVAHSMAMINVQATAASMQLAADPASAAEAIQAIRRPASPGCASCGPYLRCCGKSTAGTRGARAGPARHHRARRGDELRRHADHAGARRAAGPAGAGLAGRLPIVRSRSPTWYVTPAGSPRPWACGKTADTCMWTWSTTAGPRRGLQ